MLLLVRPCLLLLLFCGHRRVDIQHAIGKFHAHFTARNVDCIQIRFRERDIELLARVVGDD